MAAKLVTADDILELACLWADAVDAYKAAHERRGDVKAAARIALAAEDALRLSARRLMPTIDDEQAANIAPLAVAWARAVDRYEFVCRRLHLPWRAYPEARGLPHEDTDGWQFGVPVEEELASAVNEAHAAEATLYRAVRAYTDGTA